MKRLSIVLLIGLIPVIIYAGTNFPTSIDTFADKTASDVITSAGWNNMQDAIEALETKVGADGSADATSLDYDVAALETTMGTTVSDITALETTMGVVTSDIDTIQTTLGSATSQNVSDLVSIANTAGATLGKITIGYTQRARFAWSDADTLTIGPGVYHHSGTTDQIVYWNSALSFDSTDSGSQWYYLYIDDSAIVSAGTNLLTAAEFINSTTAPTWSDAKHGWYNGSDRCIFAYYVSSGSIGSFTHDGGDYIQYRATFNDQSTTDITTDTAITLTVPDIAPDAQMLLMTGGDNSVTNRSLVTVGLRVIGVFALNHNLTSNARVSTDSNQQIALAISDYAGRTEITIWTQGWYLPTGM